MRLNATRVMSDVNAALWSRLGVAAVSELNGTIGHASLMGRQAAARLRVRSAAKAAVDWELQQANHEKRSE